MIAIFVNKIDIQKKKKEYTRNREKKSCISLKYYL